MSNYNDDKKYGFNNKSYSSKNITQHGKKLPVQDEEVKIIGIKPEISRNVSAIGRNIEFRKAQPYSDKETWINWQCLEVSSPNIDYCGQYYTSYYQLQPDSYNQCQHYCHHITTQQAPYITDYDKEKWIKSVLLIV